MDQQAPKLHDIKGLVPYKWTALDYGLLVGAILLVVAAVFLLWYLWRRYQLTKAKAIPGLSYFEMLQQRLQTLQPPTPFTGKNAQNYYLQLNMLMREYLEYKLKIRSTDMTTQELLKYLPMYLPTHFTDRHTLQEFFKRAEEVSFANKSTPVDEAKTWHSQVQTWVQMLNEDKGELHATS